MNAINTVNIKADYQYDAVLPVRESKIIDIDKKVSENIQKDNSDSLEKNKLNIEKQIAKIEKENLEPQSSYKDDNTRISLFSVDGLLVTRTIDLDTGEQRYFPTEDFFSYKEKVNVDVGAIVKDQS